MGTSSRDAMLVFAERRDTDGFTEPTMPKAPDPESLDELHPPGAFGERCRVPSDHGQPTVCAGVDRINVLGARDHGAERRLPTADLSRRANAPRPFYWSEGPRLSATMTMSVYFHGTDDEIDAVGTDYLYNECVGSRGANSTSGQLVRLWRRDGVLLATSEQLAWYR